MDELNEVLGQPARSSCTVAGTNYFKEKRVIEKMARRWDGKYKDTVREWREAKERQLESLKRHLQQEIRLIDRQLD